MFNGHLREEKKSVRQMEMRHQQSCWLDRALIVKPAALPLHLGNDCTCKDPTHTRIHMFIMAAMSLIGTCRSHQVASLMYIHYKYENWYSLKGQGSIPSQGIVQLHSGGKLHFRSHIQPLRIISGK